MLKVIEDIANWMFFSAEVTQSIYQRMFSPAVELESVRHPRRYENHSLRKGKYIYMYAFQL
jgi:hypothetical protein